MAEDTGQLFFAYNLNHNCIILQYINVKEDIFDKYCRNLLQIIKEFYNKSNKFSKTSVIIHRKRKQ